MADDAMHAQDGERGPFDLAPGETYDGRARAAVDADGRPSRRFLEAAATSLLRHMPDPVSAARVAAGLAEAHDLQVSMPPMAVIEKEAPNREDAAVATVGLENAGMSTHVTVHMSKRFLSPEAALGMAAALIYQAAAARAVHDLEKGFVSLSGPATSIEPREGIE